ncbi:alpha-amylase family glycosyl hydrolase [Pseudotabrizicola sp. L79]|uniref:alpha-amylase family glycosyl hydrolase n=1 Tax=Pseudotabrizicola sp. L79 TaxID=3118402 RepID=UPI002F92F04B
MTEWWRGSVTYQVYPRSFQDSDGDGIGDLKGITMRLPYLADLGVEAIWLSPIFRSPMADMGYDVSDYTDVDPLFGDLADFDALVSRAHDLGLKVIIDQVISHSSDQHPFFQNSRQSRSADRADWYVWADAQPDGSPPNNWLSVFGGSAWEWDSRRRQYYLHNFLPSQPDFNFHNPAVQDWALDVLRFWLDRGVDGFRLDTVNYYFHDRQLRSNGPLAPKDNLPPVNPYELQDHLFSKSQPENLGWLQRIRALLDGYEGRTTVGEVGDAPWRNVQIMADYTRPGRLHMAYSFDMLGPEFTAAHFRDKIEGFFNGAPDGWPMWAFSNHDVVRHATRWQAQGAADAVAKQACAMLLSFEGSICLYQGEELGQTETDIDFHELTDPPGIRFWPDYKGRDGCRTPMVWDASDQGGFTTGHPWLPIKPPQRARNMAAQAGLAGSVLEFYREMLAYRRATPALRVGRTRFFDLPEPVLAFTRDPGLGCVFNLSAKPVSMTAEADLAGGPQHAAHLGGGRLTLGPNGFCFLRPKDGVLTLKA